LGVSHALAHFLQMEVSPEFFLRLGLEAENMQHGHSSGLDLKICLQGGCVLVDQHGQHPRALSRLPLFLVNTGTPVTTTGECVAEAAAHFRAAALLDELATVTRMMDAALAGNDFASLQAGIRCNHALLVRIGVV